MPLRRSAATDELLRTWEVENPVARQRFGELMTASGIEPPDTDLLAWGDVMGYDESRVGDRVATALEQAIEDDLLTPAPGGFDPHRLRAQAPALAELAKLARLVLAGPGASEALCARLGVRGLHGDLITAAHDIAGLPRPLDAPREDQEEAHPPLLLAEPRGTVAHLPPGSADREKFRPGAEDFGRP